MRRPQRRFQTLSYDMISSLCEAGKFYREINYFSCE